MRFVWIIICLGLLVSCGKEQKIHVPSPEWQDQIVYFLMIDRFNDGDKSINDQGVNLYDPQDNSSYSGGDLQGVTDKVDYIKGLGATAIWITPPVANLWYNPSIGKSGYHGYWARNFKEVDEHYGTLENYKALSHKTHDNDMYLIQDIVINHTGRFFQYEGNYNPIDTAENFTLISGSLPASKPTQPPFDMNDRHNPDHVQADIYNWTPEITDYHQQIQEFTYQTSGLNDINTVNPAVRTALKDSYRYWIDEVGVDAFRLDTAKYVEHEFLNDFIHAEDGILSSAAKTGRDSFPIFGEIFEMSAPLKDEGERKIARFMGSPEKPELPSIINFPLFEEMVRVFTQGRPTHTLSYRLNKQMEIYDNPYVILNFVDNHDVQRFLQKGSVAAFKQALALIMTVPGIPAIYQGDEQAHLETRQAMFAGGYANKKGSFDTTSEMYLYIKNLANLRTENKIFSRGTFETLGDNKTGSGALVYKREYEGKTALVLFNSADHKTLLSNLNTGLQSGQKLSRLWAENFDGDLRVGADGKVTVELPARAILILLVQDGAEAEIKAEITAEILAKKKVKITVDQNLEGKILKGTTAISGSVSLPDVLLKLVIDGNLDEASEVLSDHEGHWSAVLSVEDLGQESHSFSLYAVDQKTASLPQYYQTNVSQSEFKITLDDAIGDDVGPKENYIKPQASGYDGQMDIEQVTVKTGGKNLQLTLKMKDLNSQWLAPNGFDHVIFSIYFDLPGQDGSTDLPFLYSKTPSEFKWDMGNILFGWGSQIYNSEGADSLHLGRKLPVTPEFKVDHEARTITINYYGATLGVSSWKNAKVYISTWDTNGGDGTYRAMTKEGGTWVFGGDDIGAAYILDDLPPIVIDPEK